MNKIHFNPPQRVYRFIAWRLRRPEKGNADGARCILWNVWAHDMRSNPPKNGLVPYSYAGGAYDKYSTFLFGGATHFFPLGGARFGRPWCMLQGSVECVLSLDIPLASESRLPKL